jgi:hypothetical protein
MRWAVILALVAACGGEATTGPQAEANMPEPPAEAVVKEQDAGPAKIAIKLWPATPTLGDSIYLRVEVTSDPGVAVDLPFEQAALGRFAVHRYATDTQRTDDGGSKRMDTYELGAPMSGKHRIPPFRIVLHPPSAEPVEILTEELPLDVGAVLADRTDRALRPPPGALPTEVGATRPWPFVIGGAAGALVIAGAVFGWLAWRKRAVRMTQEGAWDLAIRRLAELEARGAPGADQADAWFVELSGIVRHYVEGRYQLRAPELTTEEFLGEARRLVALTAAHRELLGAFLTQCDQVKFAGYRPAEDESLGVLRVARGFVHDTRPRDDAAAPLESKEGARAVVA